MHIWDQTLWSFLQGSYSLRFHSFYMILRVFALQIRKIRGKLPAIAAAWVTVESTVMQKLFSPQSSLHILNNPRNKDTPLIRIN